MKLRYTLRAAADLNAIADYLAARSPRGAGRVRAAILSTLANIAFFPGPGRRQATDGVRMIKTRRFPYLIFNSVDMSGDEIVVLTIRHAARERRFTET